MLEYVSPNKIRSQYQVSYQSLVNWSKQEKIRFIQTPGGARKYHLGDVLTLLGVNHNQHAETKKNVILYARVSSRKQSADLQRQIERLRTECPQHDDLISDIGSGLNWKRPGFLRLLDTIRQGRVEKLVVSYRDRLCRFGFALVERVCGWYNTQIVVLSEAEKSEVAGESEELQQDLLSIVNVFVARNSGRRSGGRKKRRLATTSSEEETDDEGEEGAGR